MLYRTKFHTRMIQQILHSLFPARLYTCIHRSTTKNLHTVHRTITEREGRVFTITCSHLGCRYIEWEGIREGGRGKKGLHAVRPPLRGFYYTTYNWHINLILKGKVSAPSQQSYGKTVNRLRNLLVAFTLPRFPSQPKPPLNPPPPTPATRTKRPHTHANSEGAGVWRYHRRLLQHSQTCICYSQLTTWPPDPKENISLVLAWC